MTINMSLNMMLFLAAVEFRYQELVAPLPNCIKACSCSYCLANFSCFRPQYYKIIEECVSQIVLHCSGMDPDFKYRGRMDINFTHLVGLYSLSSFTLGVFFVCVSSVQTYTVNFFSVLEICMYATGVLGEYQTKCCSL